MLCFLFVCIIWRQLNVLSQYVWVHISKSTLLLCCDLHASIQFWLGDAKMWKLFLQIPKRQVHIKLRAECYHCFPMAWSDPPQWGVRSKTVNSVQNYQHCTVYNVQCTMYSVQCTVHNVQCTMYSAQYIVYNVQCTMYSVQCVVYTIHITVYCVQCTLVFSAFTLLCIVEEYYVLYCVGKTPPPTPAEHCTETFHNSWTVLYRGFLPVILHHCAVHCTWDSAQRSKSLICASL